MCETRDLWDSAVTIAEFQVDQAWESRFAIPDRDDEEEEEEGDFDGDAHDLAKMGQGEC